MGQFTGERFSPQRSGPAGHWYVQDGLTGLPFGSGEASITMPYAAATSTAAYLNSPEGRAGHGPAGVHGRTPTPMDGR